MKINSNDQLDLKGKCLSGCNFEQSIYSFNLYMLNSNSNSFLRFTNYSKYVQTGSTETEITVKKDLFQDFSSQKIWKIELNVFFPIQNISGSASIFFMVNFPPKDGSCGINPKNGSTSTLFTISCLNWIDSDGNVDSFAYYGFF